jgi:PAS domain S-box-containing protein
MSEYNRIEELRQLSSKVAAGIALMDIIKMAFIILPHSVVITDRDANILWTNTAFTANTGYEMNEVLGKKTNILKSGVHGIEFYKQMWETLSNGDIWSGEIVNRFKDGKLYLEKHHTFFYDWA